MRKAILLAALLSVTTFAWAESAREATDDRLKHAGEVLHEIMAAPDKGIPEEVLEHAKCVAVVPHMIKGGFVFGAEGGTVTLSITRVKRGSTEKLTWRRTPARRCL